MRLIDADELLTAFPVDDELTLTKSCVRMTIQHMPTIEPQPDVPDTNVGDTISRQAAIRWVKTECNPYGKPTLEFESGKKVIEHLEQMPSAQPLSDEDYIELHDRFGTWVEEVVRDMISGEGKRWGSGQRMN